MLRKISKEKRKIRLLIIKWNSIKFNKKKVKVRNTNKMKWTQKGERDSEEAQEKVVQKFRKTRMKLSNQ